MSCLSCNRDKPTPARGLCAACYQRWRKTGTTEYQRKVSICSVGGCDRRVAANGLCNTHAMRMRRHGHLNDTRPDSWGAVHKHPLFNSWAHARRNRAKHPMAAGWADDFLQFVNDLGERPSPKHKLFTADLNRPLGPDNFVWKRAITERAEGEDHATYMNRAQKVYRAVRKESFKGHDLKRRFGISPDEYANMSSAQGHSCAICRRSETVIIRSRKTTLAVDHCHATGSIRGLLCARCNRGLGLFEDNVESLRAAIEYLERHAPSPDPSPPEG